MTGGTPMTQETTILTYLPWFINELITGRGMTLWGIHQYNVYVIISRCISSFHDENLQNCPTIFPLQAALQGEEPKWRWLLYKPMKTYEY